MSPRQALAGAFSAAAALTVTAAGGTLPTATFATPVIDVATRSSTFDDLPTQAQAFVRRVEQLISCPVDLISVGPAREQAIIVNPIL